jgi:hypothetical protein
MLKWMQVVKEALVAAGWTLKGEGDGVDDGDMTGTTYWPTFASGTTGMAAGAWICIQNTDGAHLVLWSDTVSTTQVGMWYSASGGYTSSMGEGVSTRVGSSSPPADERTVVIQTAGSAEVGGGGDYYSSVATSNDGNNVITWGFRSSLPGAEVAMMWGKVTGEKSGDTEAYFGYRNGASGSDVWGVADLSDTPTNFVAYHSGSASLVAHGATEIKVGGTDIMDTIPTNPDSAGYDLVQSLLASDVGGSISIKGVLPGVRRVSTILAQGDLVGSNGAYVVVGDYGLPWNSFSAPSM